MSNIIDLELTDQNTVDACFDLVIAPNGDLAQVASFDTALLMSLFCEQRADESEVPSPYLRRGWWGNECNDDDTFEIGSKLWIVTAQPRNIDEVQNKAITYCQNCLSWLVTDGYLDETQVSASFTDGPLQINIELLRSQNVVLSKYYDIWEASGNFK